MSELLPEPVYRALFDVLDELNTRDLEHRGALALQVVTIEAALARMDTGVGALALGEAKRAVVRLGALVADRSFLDIPGELNRINFERPDGLPSCT